MSALFPDHLIPKAEEEIKRHEDKRTPSSSSKGPQRFHPYSQSGRQQQLDQDRKSGLPAWKQLRRRRGQRSHQAKLLLSPSDLPRHRSSTNDNYYVATSVVKDLNSVTVIGKDCHCVNLSLKTRTISPV